MGYDADFVIWSPEETFTVTTGDIQHKNKITPYLDMQLHGVVHKEGCFSLLYSLYSLKILRAHNLSSSFLAIFRHCKGSVLEFRWKG